MVRVRSPRPAKNLDPCIAHRSHATSAIAYSNRWETSIEARPPDSDKPVMTQFWLGLGFAALGSLYLLLALLQRRNAMFEKGDPQRKARVRTGLIFLIVGMTLCILHTSLLRSVSK